MARSIKSNSSVSLVNLARETRTAIACAALNALQIVATEAIVRHRVIAHVTVIVRHQTVNATAIVIVLQLTAGATPNASVTAIHMIAIAAYTEIVQVYRRSR